MTDPPVRLPLVLYSVSVIGTATVPVEIGVVPSPITDTTTPPAKGAALAAGSESIAATVRATLQERCVERCLTVLFIGGGLASERRARIEPIGQPAMACPDFN
jgi:hypothetical protein